MSMSLLFWLLFLLFPLRERHPDPDPDYDSY